MGGIKAKQNFDSGDEAAVVVPSSTVDIPGIPAQGAFLWIGTGGTVYVDMAVYGTNVPYVVQSGTVPPIRVRRVYATSTAADIVAFW